MIRESPVIIGNAPSSGSSLLRVMLQRHPSISGGGEVALLDKPGLYDESPASYCKNIDRWITGGYPSLYFGGGPRIFSHLNDYPWTAESLREFCAGFGSFEEMVKGFFARNLEEMGGQRWLEKTPPNIYCFHRIREIYPDAKFIHIVRDARDSMASHYRRSGDAFFVAGSWYFATLVGIQYSSWPNYYRVRYEDLVLKPEETLRELCDFIGEEFTEMMLATDDSERRKIPSWKQSHFDNVTSSSIGQYKEALNDEIRSMFQQLRLSSHGHQMMNRSGLTSGVMTPVELQSHLGYDIDFLETTDKVSATARRQARSVFRKWRWDCFKLYRKWAKCPLKVCG